MPRFHIVQFMSLIVIAAIVALALARPGEAIDLIPVVLGLMLVSPIVLPLIPGSLESVLRNPPEDLGTHTSVLERALTYRSIIRFGPILQARMNLMQLYMRQDRFDDAIAQGKTVLSRYRARRSLASHIHLDIAICLEGLGHQDEAVAARRRAAHTLDIPPVDALGWLVQGRLFSHKQRYDLAADAYQRALTMPAAQRQINLSDTCTLLAAACVKAGRFEDAIKWVTLALTMEKTRGRMFGLHRLAASAFSRLGRLSEQEDHLWQAHELAGEAQNKKWIAESLASLAEVERSRGNLGKASSMCLEALSLSPESAREAFHVRASICRTEGQFEQALKNMTKACQVGVMKPPEAERRVQAIFKLHIARSRADLGQIGQAWEDLRNAKAELEDDPGLAPWCEALGIRLGALEGARGETVVRAEKLLHSSTARRSTSRSDQTA